MTIMRCSETVTSIQLVVRNVRRLNSSHSRLVIIVNDEQQDPLAFCDVNADKVVEYANILLR